MAGPKVKDVAVEVDTKRTRIIGQIRSFFSAYLQNPLVLNDAKVLELQSSLQQLSENKDEPKRGAIIAKDCGKICHGYLLSDFEFVRGHSLPDSNTKELMNRLTSFNKE